MTGYDIFLSNGNLLTTINVKTVDDRAHSSLVLIGQGIPDYGQQWAQDFVWLLENFSNGSPPTHPIIGQLWHDRVADRMKYYSTQGTWVTLANA
jgi:hypothetical protein